MCTAVESDNDSETGADAGPDVVTASDADSDVHGVSSDTHLASPATPTKLAPPEAANAVRSPKAWFAEASSSACPRCLAAQASAEWDACTTCALAQSTAQFMRRCSINRQSVESSMGFAMRAGKKRGTVVHSVIPSLPAHKGGLRIGDLILYVEVP